MKFFIFAVALVASFSALADQCAWNKLTDAKSAKSLIKDNDIILWCQNCGEKNPSNILKVKDVNVKKPANDSHELTVIYSNGNQDQIDLAYTYVRTASDVFTNVAQLVGCPSEGATTFIQTGPGVKKTAHFYDKKGKRVDVVSTKKEIQVAEFHAANNTTNRVPASATPATTTNK
jgi:intein-encoded DNA endonuclease-like protein